MSSERHLAARSSTAFAAGLLFGVGLLVSGMGRPSKVLGFLDIAGDWDPSLLFVMGGAIAVHVVFTVGARRAGARPVFARVFDVPTRGDVDARLLAGAALFGVGWGISGYCPGPALVSLASASGRTIAFVAAMMAGTLLARRVLARAPNETSRHRRPPDRGMLDV